MKFSVKLLNIYIEKPLLIKSILVRCKNTLYSQHFNLDSYYDSFYLNVTNISFKYNNDNIIKLEGDYDFIVESDKNMIFIFLNNKVNGNKPY